MRSPIAVLLLVSARNTAKKPSATNFTSTINQYLTNMVKPAQSSAARFRWAFQVSAKRSI
jgi:hypothetical protein